MKRYTAEFRAAALRRVSETGQVSGTARELGVSYETLRTWRRSSQKSSRPEEELLRTEINILRTVMDSALKRLEVAISGKLRPISARTYLFFGTLVGATLGLSPIFFLHSNSHSHSCTNLDDVQVIHDLFAVTGKTRGVHESAM